MVHHKNVFPGTDYYDDPKLLSTNKPDFTGLSDNHPSVPE